MSATDKIPIQKQCPRCGVIKLAVAFHRNKNRFDGLQIWCKPCKAAHSHSTRPLYRDKRSAKHREWKMRNPHKSMEYVRKYSSSETEKIKLRCRRRTMNAIRRGRLVRKPCEQCGRPKADAHHDDYNKPFDVRWLCDLHHNQLHHSKEAAENAELRAKLPKADCE